MKNTGSDFLRKVNMLDLAENGFFVFFIFVCVMLLAILFYNDAKKDLKYSVNKDVLQHSLIVDKLIEKMREYDCCPKIEIVAFNTFARIFYPKRYEVRGQETFSFVLDKSEDFMYFTENKFSFSESEIKIFIRALYEKMVDLYPEAVIDYDRYKLTVEFYKQKTGFVMR